MHARNFFLHICINKFKNKLQKKVQLKLKLSIIDILLICYNVIITLMKLKVLFVYVNALYCP